MTKALLSLPLLASLALSASTKDAKPQTAATTPMYEVLKRPCAKDLASRCPGKAGFEAMGCLGAVDKSRLAKSCRDAMSSSPAAKSTVLPTKADGICDGAFAKACPGAKPGVALYKCLKEHDSELPETCRVKRKAH
ncbi:MAG: hypothetical protein HY077_05030 [Elusimicrobia bacterium]|nr:hypothetical protein [Elusimicrobiota bacterium]